MDSLMYEKVVEAPSFTVRIYTSLFILYSGNTFACYTTVYNASLYVCYPIYCIYTDIPPNLD